MTAEQHPESHNGLRVELPRAWEPLVSWSAAQYCAAVGSQSCVLVRNENEDSSYEEDQNEVGFC